MQNFSKFILTTLTIISVLLLNGCATSTLLSAANRQAIHTISVDKNVSLPKQGILYVGPDQANGAVFGGMVGAIIGGAAEANKPKQITQLALANHIYIGQIVRNQFIEQLNQKPGLRVTEPPADAQLEIQLGMYGLSVPHGFTSELAPRLQIKAELVRNNQIVWSNSSSYLILGSQGSHDYTLQQIRQNPQLLFTMWNAAAKTIVANMLSNF